MPFSIILEIDLTKLNNTQKGSFFSEVNKLIPSHEFQPFRSAISKKAKVYTALDTEYDKLINIRKMIRLLDDNTGNFTVYQETENEQATLNPHELDNIIAEFKAVHQLPSFKYHPNVYESGKVSFYKDVCEVCNQESSFVIEGCYGENELEVICIHCIASGKAGQEPDVLFNYQYPTTFHDQNIVEELQLRTPSFLSWQEVPWLEHCHDFCAYIGQIDGNGVSQLESELHDDITSEAAIYHLQHDDFIKALNSYIFGHLFKCLHCGKHRLITELS